MLFLFLLTLQKTQGQGLDELGTIWPAGVLPISNSYTNVLKTSDYTFTFRIDHALPQNSKLTVTFPSQFQPGLGISVCKSSMGLCSVSNTTVTVTLSSALYRQKTYSLVVYGVKNPASGGGTGNFQMQSWKGLNLVDSNMIFGVVGIAQTVGALLSAGVNFVAGDSQAVGALSRYEFKFRLYRPLAAWNWLRFTFPNDGFVFDPNPTCTAFKIESFVLAGTLLCNAAGNQVTLTGVSNEIPAFTHVGVRVSAQNPKTSLVTGAFSIETGKNGTYTVYDEITGIPGVVISAGGITKVSLSPANSSVILSTNKQVLYRLQFLTSNQIPLGGRIEIQCTASFSIIGNFFLESGLTESSSSSFISFLYNPATYLLKISGFISSFPQLVSMLLMINNPSTPGLTDPLMIRSFDSAGSLIDENTWDAFALIAEMTSPTACSVSFPTTNQAAGSAINLILSFTPGHEVPADGWVSFIVPLGFTAPTTQTCFVKPTNEVEQAAQTCYYENGSIFIQLFSDSPGIFGKFEAGLSSYVRISSLISPILAGSYIFDFQTYSVLRLILESGSAVGVLVASVLTPAITVIHTSLATPTLIEITFTLGKDLASGLTPTTPTSLVGYLELSFPTLSGAALLFPTDLGLASTQVPCLGVLGIDASISCFITTAPTTASTPVVVTVTNFSRISAGTFIKIHIAGIKYTISNSIGSITVTSYQVYYRVRYNLESGSQSLPPGVTLPVKTNSGVSLTLSDKTVLTQTLLSTGTPYTTTVASGAISPYILVHIFQTHDNGYCTSQIVCTLDGVQTACTCYPIADMILIPLSATYTAASHTFQVSGLINPESVPVINDDLLFYIIGNSAVTQYISFAGAIPKLQAGSLATQIFPSQLGKGYVFVYYSFTLVPSHYIPVGGAIQIVFPAEYTVSSSSPLPSCSSEYLHPVGPMLSCVLTGNVFTITSFTQMNATNVIVVNVRGIKNPTVSASSQFVTQTLNSAQRIIDQNSLAGLLTFTSLWLTNTIKYLTITAFPSNANTTAEYIFTFTPSTFLGAGSIIKIDFPLKQFGVLPSSPLCRLSGEVTTLLSCSTSASDLFITTDTDLPYKSLSLSIIGLKNFDQGSSDPFIITTSYDNVVLQTTGTGTSQLSAKTSAQAALLKVSTILFYPTNEGEVATYEFYFSPVLSISTTQNVIVRFPQDFDFRVGNSITCWADGLVGFLECELVHSYMIVVMKHDAFSCSGCEIVLYIAGVVNPNQGKTGQFLVGVMGEGNYTEMNENAGVVTITPAPMYAELISTNTSSLFARSLQTITFNVTSNQTIPTIANGGEVWVRFPADYVLDGSYINCRSSDFWASGVPKCAVNGTLIRMTGQTQEYSGNFLIYIDRVPNPLSDILTDFITFEVFDGFNRLVKSRSYSNLDPNRFKYEYPGPLIIVNNNEPFQVRRGTVSAFIPITLDYPCALNLTLIPTSNSFVFFPEQISIKIGDLLANFRISIPFDTEDTEYIILWSILGEIDPAYYTPILKSLFRVVKDSVLEVSIEDIMPIPIGATSLPVFVTLSGGPNVDLTVHLSLPDSIAGVELSSKELVFLSGEYLANFTISASAGVTRDSSQVLVVLSGTNAEAYTLPRTSVPFKVVQESGPPEVLGVGVIKTTRVSALITITTSKFCWCYYAYSLRGSLAPSFEETKAQGPPAYPSTLTMYGVLRVAGSTTALLNITSLNAGVRYSLVIWAEDLSGSQSASYQRLEFDTDVIYNTARLSLRFLQVYLNDVEILKTNAVIQLYLSLHDWRIETDEQQTLQLDQNKIYSTSAKFPTVTFYLLDKTDTGNYPSPIQMVFRLQGLKKRFEEKLNNVDSSYEITGEEVNLGGCRFERYPHVVNESSSYEFIGMQASLVDDGYVFAVALLADNDPGMPFAFQVMQGNDRWNRPALSARANASAGVIADFSFPQVDNSTNYNIYVICTNDNPGYLQPMNDSEVAFVYWTTAPKPLPIPFSIDFSILMELGSFLLISV